MRSDEREQAAGTAGAATWTDPAWRGAALAWADEELDRAGLVRTGELEQPHVYPWSTALRLPVGDSAVWLKSVGPGSGHEPALWAALGRWVPDHVLVPLAVEPDRRLMLLPDGGRTLHDAGGSTRVDAWESMLHTYTRLQLELVPPAAEMLALGVPDHRPSRLPAWSPTCWPTTTPGSRSRGGTQARGPRSCGGRPRAVRGALRTPHRRWRPLDVQHDELPDELHDANVFVSGNRHRFFDWATRRSHTPSSACWRPCGWWRGHSTWRRAIRSCCGCGTPFSICGAATGHRSSCASSAPHEPGPLTPAARRD